jgi:hypothetical protein
VSSLGRRGGIGMGSGPKATRFAVALGNVVGANLIKLILRYR